MRLHLSLDDRQDLVSRSIKSSDKRLTGAGFLIVLGRLCFAITTICIFSRLLFGWPPHLFPIMIGLAMAVALLLLAGYLLRDFRWLWQMPVIAVAFAGLAIGCAMFKQYFACQPHHLTFYEAYVGFLGLVTFGGCVILFRRFK